MKLERSESRNAAACAISSAAAMRFIGCNPAMNSRAAGFPSPPAGVIVPPGNSALTRIFSDACSDASDCTRPSRPAFDAAYAPIPGIPPLLTQTHDAVQPDRQHAGKGKSVSVRVDLGGVRNIKKKKR